MKIKESKYYHPVNVLQVDSDDHIELYDKYKLLTFTNPYRTIRRPDGTYLLWW